MRVFNLAPQILNGTLTTNILSPYGYVAGIQYVTTGTFIVLRHIRILNVAGTSAYTFSLWKGASGGNVAGTEVIGSGVHVDPATPFEWWGELRLDVGEYLVGGSTSGVMTINAEGYMGVV